jgi:hypothetical protein
MINKKHNRKTAGQISQELQAKAVDEKPVDVREQTQNMFADYMDNVFKAVDEGLKTHEGDFYVIVLTKSEPLMPNIIRNYFLSGPACPTPNYDQAVFKYHRDSDDIEFIWQIPNRDMSIWMLENKPLVDPSEYGILKMIEDFASGDLLQKARILNGEVEGKVDRQEDRNVIG